MTTLHSTTGRLEAHAQRATGVVRLMWRVGDALDARFLELTVELLDGRFESAGCWLVNGSGARAREIDLPMGPGAAALERVGRVDLLHIDAPGVVTATLRKRGQSWRALYARTSALALIGARGGSYELREAVFEAAPREASQRTG